jgi:hypothetical protein
MGWDGTVYFGFWRFQIDLTMVFIMIFSSLSVITATGVSAAIYLVA